MSEFPHTKGPAESVFVVNWSQIGSGDLQPVINELQAIEDFLIASGALLDKTYSYVNGEFTTVSPVELIAAPGAGNYLSIRNGIFQNAGEESVELNVSYGASKEFTLKVDPDREVVLSFGWDDELDADENTALTVTTSAAVRFFYWIQYRERIV